MPEIKNGMKRTSVLLTVSQLEGIDKMVKDGKYPNRSEAIRTAVRDLLVKGM
jgi:Arc/MetJ-type ribon-helix-helix transcriptional regulator